MCDKFKRKRGIDVPFVPVPKDLSKVKNKMAFGLTLRQILSIACALILGIPAYFICVRIVGSSIAIWIMMFIMAPCFLVGFFEKDGQPFERYLKHYINAKYVRPQVRPYKTMNSYDIINQKIKINEEVNRYAANHIKKGKACKKNKSVQSINCQGKKATCKNDKAVKKSRQNS